MKHIMKLVLDSVFLEATKSVWASLTFSPVGVMFIQTANNANYSGVFSMVR